MRPLTSDELKLLLERGVEALPDRNADEVVEALALEVSERRLADRELAAGLASLGLPELRRIRSAVVATRSAEPEERT